MLDFRQSVVNITLGKVQKRLHIPLEVMLTCVRWYSFIVSTVNPHCASNREDLVKIKPLGLLAFAAVIVAIFGFSLFGLANLAVRTLQ